MHVVSWKQHRRICFIFKINLIDSDIVIFFGYDHILLKVMLALTSVFVTFAYVMSKIVLLSLEAAVVLLCGVLLISEFYHTHVTGV